MIYSNKTDFMISHITLLQEAFGSLWMGLRISQHKTQRLTIDCQNNTQHLDFGSSQTKLRAMEQLGGFQSTNQMEEDLILLKKVKQLFE